MKDKIMIFIIGVLVGAVLSTGAFYIYTAISSKDSGNNMQMNGGQPPDGDPPEKPDGEGGQLPDKPDGENTENSNRKDKKTSTNNSESKESA